MGPEEGEPLETAAVFTIVGTVPKTKKIMAQTSMLTRKRGFALGVVSATCETVFSETTGAWVCCCMSPGIENALIPHLWQNSIWSSNAVPHLTQNFIEPPTTVFFIIA